MKKLFVFNLQRLLCVVILLVAGMSFALAQTNKAWNKDWSGRNSYGDARFVLTLNVDKKQALNEFNEASKCNGFLSVYMVEPSGYQSLLETYELHVQSVQGNTAVLTFKGGRDIDLGSGTCKAVLKNGRLQLMVTKGSQDVLFNKAQLK